MEILAGTAVASSCTNLASGRQRGLKRKRSASNGADAYREKKLGLRHQIFLSYSGADQGFIWELYDDLLEHNYDPFFDKKSLPKTAPVSMKNIVQEAANSKLAVFCLSEAFFTKNRNPMLELVECVKNEVRIMPLFYEISVGMIKQSMDSWYSGEWSKWENIDRNELKQALETLLHISGIENIEGWRPRQFRRRVVEEIQKIVPLDIRPDVSGICGGDRLIMVVKDMFDKHMSLDQSTQSPSVILGLYGASGTGKSTLCKMLEHTESSVCYIELDMCMDEKAQLERMKKVLRSVTNLSIDFINKLTNPDEAKEKLFAREYEKKVFLIIDNCMPFSESLNEARMYLDDGCRWFKPGSRLLITTHTKDVLDTLADVGGKWHIDGMPELKKEEAKRILLKRAGGSIQVKEQLVERCLNLCLFEKGGGKGVHYHPLVLNALAESLADHRHYSMQEEMTKWVASLESSFSLTDSAAKEKVLRHLLKSTMYYSLNDFQKQVFLDIAFYLPAELQGKGEILEWLHMVHGKNIEEAVRILERRGLIDLSGLPSSRTRIRLMHDLYYEMATLIMQEKGSKCLLMQGDEQLPYNCENRKRIRFDKYHFSDDLVMQNFPSLQVLAIVGCEGMVKLDLRGAVCLRSLEISCKFRFYSEMVHLRNLRYLNLDLNSLDFDPHLDFSFCIHLEYLILRNGSKHPNLRALMNLRVFRYLNCRSNWDCGPVVFDLGHKIESIHILGCDHVSGLRGLTQNCTSFRELILIKCKELKALEGLAELKVLKNLHWPNLGLKAMPKLQQQIEDVITYDCNFIPAEDIIAIPKHSCIGHSGKSTKFTSLKKLCRYISSLLLSSGQ